MYRGILKYGALTTKISGMAGKMLKKEDYLSLSQMKSVPEAVTYIRTKTAYGECLAGYSGELHRETLEKMLRHSLFKDFAKLKKYITNRKDKEFLNAVMCRYEIYLLETVIRGCMIEDNTTHLLYDLPEEFEDALSFDAARVVAARNMSQVVEALQGSPYEKVLSVLYTRGRTPTLFEIETNLDIFFFRKLWDLIEKQFQGKSKKYLQETIGTEADLLNVLWIYRCKKYYNLANEHVYALLLPVHYELTTQKIRAFVETKSFEECIQMVKDTKYAKLAEYQSRWLYEKALMKVLTDLFRKIRGKDPYSIVTVIGYLYQKELELENICSVIEGVRYQIGPEKIMEYVV